MKHQTGNNDLKSDYINLNCENIEVNLNIYLYIWIYKRKSEYIVIILSI